MVREGRITPEQAAVHPQRSIVTRVVGVERSVDVDVAPLDLQPGDRLLLCSDGLTGMVGSETIADALRSNADPDAAAARLIEAANAGGGEDNITVLVLDVLDDGTPVAPSSITAAIGTAAAVTTAAPERDPAPVVAAA